jgi:hypothetical protein
MKEKLNKVWKSSKETASSQTNRALEHTCAGRVISALTFIMVLFSLGLWVTAFLQLKDQLFTQTLSGNVFTNLTCLFFFGGLIVALFVGAMAGNFLRRIFWRMLTKRVH